MPFVQVENAGQAATVPVALPTLSPVHLVCTAPLMAFSHQRVYAGLATSAQVATHHQVHPTVYVQLATTVNREPQDQHLVQLAHSLVLKAS